MNLPVRNLVTLLLVATGMATQVPAAQVTIENRSDRTFYYSLRQPGDSAWSPSHRIPPGESQTHNLPARVRISYLSDAAQFAWLEANQVYRITDVKRGRLRKVTQVRRPTLPDPRPDTGSAAASADDTTTRSKTALPAADPGLPVSPKAAAAEESAGAGRGADAGDDDPTHHSAGAEQSPAAGDASTENRPDAPSPTKVAPIPGRAPAGATTATGDSSTEPFDGLFDITNRVVTVRAIADSTYRNAFPEWRERARRVIAGASAYYQREHAIRLVVTETRAWDYDGLSDDLKARWSRLLHEPPRDVDLIIAMVGYGDYSNVGGEAAFTGQLGRAAFFGQHLMLADRQDYHINRAKMILIHELGHVFGAFHVPDQNLIMYPGYLELPTDDIIAGTVPFGETLDEVISLTKGFTFRDGVRSLPPETQRRIQSLYRRHGLASESRETDPVTSGYRYLEQRAKIVATQMAQRAIEARGEFNELSK